VLGGVDFRGSVVFELLPWLSFSYLFFVILFGFVAFRAFGWLLWFFFF
jgi:hypothetical protein